MNQQQKTQTHALLTDLKSCKDLLRGRKIHAKAVEQRQNTNVYVVAALISMYAKCGSMVEARDVFDSIQKPNLVCWNVLLLGYADNGNGVTALEMFFCMKACGCMPSPVTYLAPLKACISLAVRSDDSGKEDCLKRGKNIHSEIGCHCDLHVQNTLIDMYAKCGSMNDARHVFECVEKPNVVTWNALISGYARNGDGIIALEMFSTMKARGFVADSVTYVAALKACTSLVVVNGGKLNCLKWGREIHSEIGCHLNRYVQNTLIDMYAKCGSMADARVVFDSVRKPDVVSWTAMLLGYAENGNGLVSLEMFSRMKARGMEPDSVTYVAALKACISLAVNGQEDCLERGREIHKQIGCHLDLYLQNTLIDMYAKCGSMVDASCVFYSVRDPDVVAWNALILGYAENGDGLAALEMFWRMKARGCDPSSVTYIAALKACGLIGALALGRKLHLEINDIDANLVTCLVDFYAKCGSVVEARRVFDSYTKIRDTSTWTALLAGYGSLGDTEAVFNLFKGMQDEGCRPDAVTFVCLLLCCSHTGLVEKAREYFEVMTSRYGVIPIVMHYNCMVDILGRVNQLNEAIAMILKMPCNPNAVTWRTVLGACRKWKNVRIAETAFQCLVDTDRRDSSAYVVMAQIYGSVGMWEEQVRVLERRSQVGAWKLPGQVYVMDEMGKMVAIHGTNKSLPVVPDEGDVFLHLSFDPSVTLVQHVEKLGRP